MNSLSLTEIKEVFELNENYQLIRNKSNRTDRIGCVAGCISSKGYDKVSYKGRRYSVHRLIYQLAHNVEWLSEEIQIDHIDENKSNNNPTNLRIATNQENQRNRGKNRNNTVGFKGVCYEKDRRKWKAYIDNGIRKINLGRFNTIEEANDAYVKASELYFGEFSVYEKGFGIQKPSESLFQLDYL